MPPTSASRSGRRPSRTSSPGSSSWSSSSGPPRSSPASRITADPYDEAMPGADPIADLRAALREVAQTISGDGAGVEPALERPPQAEHGDYSSNAAMLLAGSVGKPPREIAERLSGELSERLGESVERGEV